MVEIHSVRQPHQPLTGVEKVRSEQKKQRQDQGQRDHADDNKAQPPAQAIDEYA